MAYTEAQWNKFQASLPAEERMSYLDYLKETDPAAYNKLVSKILENLKTAELQSGTSITKVVDESTKIAGARADKAAQTTAKTTASQQAAARAAVTALTSGQKLTDAQKALLNIKTTAATPTTTFTPAQLQTIVATLGAGGELTPEEAAAVGATVNATPVGEVTGTPTVTGTPVVIPTGEEPPNRPGKAWMVSADGKGWIIPPKPTDGKNYKWDDNNGWVADTEVVDEYKTVDGVLTFKGSPFTGTYEGKTYKDGKVVQEPGGEEYTTVGGVLMFKGSPFTGNYNGKNYKDGKIVEEPGDQYATVNGLFTLNGKPFTGAYQGKNYKDGKLVEAPAEEDAAEEAASETTDDAAAILAKAGRQSAYDLLYTQFASYGLGSLVEPLKALIQTNVSPSEFAIKLRNDPLYNTAYKKRFAANDLRISKGLKAIDEATYLGLEDQYQSILRNAGLPESYWKRGELGIQEGFTNFIANDVSATELEDRVNTAQQRVLFANPEVSIALKTFYPDISNGDLLAYALDPTKGLDQIKRRITAAEIGSSAVQLGLATNVTDAEYLARYGVTKAQAQQGYGTIAGGLQRGSQLASIYGENPYTQTTAEREVFNVPGAQESRAQRQKLTGLEKATFGGQTGLTSGALARDRAGSF